MKKVIHFVPKRVKGDRRPWIRFGSTRTEYERWVPEICGICCLKMVGDTFHKTNHMSLYKLTMLCLQKGGFTITAGGCIGGVFHRPLLELAKEFGVDGWVGKLDQKTIIDSLHQHKLIILSINLNIVSSHLHGGHLILVHIYDLTTNFFVVHDPSYLLNKKGKNIRIHADYLASISNKKGIVLWLKKRKNNT